LSLPDVHVGRKWFYGGYCCDFECDTGNACLWFVAEIFATLIFDCCIVFLTNPCRFLKPTRILNFSSDLKKGIKISGGEYKFKKWLIVMIL
jgi:hypothetical protein